MRVFTGCCPHVDAYNRLRAAAVMQHRHQRLPQDEVAEVEEPRPEPTHRLLVPPAPLDDEEDEVEDELDGSTGANSQSGLTSFEVDAAVLGLSEEVGPSVGRVASPDPGTG